MSQHKHCSDFGQYCKAKQDEAKRSYGTFKRFSHFEYGLVCRVHFQRHLQCLRQCLELDVSSPLRGLLETGAVPGDRIAGRLIDSPVEKLRSGSQKWQHATLVLSIGMGMRSPQSLDDLRFDAISGIVVAGQSLDEGTELIGMFPDVLRCNLP